MRVQPPPAALAPSWPFPAAAALGRRGIRRRFGPNEFPAETEESLEAPGRREPRCPRESGIPGTPRRRAWAPERGLWRAHDPGLPQPACREPARTRERARGAGASRARNPACGMPASPRVPYTLEGRPRAVGRGGMRARGYECEPQLLRRSGRQEVFRGPACNA